MKQLQLVFKSSFPMAYRSCGRCIYSSRGSANLSGVSCAVDHRECLGETNEYNFFMPEQRHTEAYLNGTDFVDPLSNAFNFIRRATGR